jgi:Zn-dependent protease with chaperone function
MTPLKSFFDRRLLCALSVFCALALSACGGQSASQSHTNVVAIETQFQPVVDAFTAASKAQGSPVAITDLIIQSTPDFPTDSEMGVCTQETGTTPTIQISQPLWDSLDADGQQELLFHELGHCVLNRVHDTVLNNGVPVSVMSPVFFGSALYDANKAQYLQELFTQPTVSANLNMIIPENALLPDFSEADSSL